MSTNVLKIGYIPEHFSAPIFLGEKHGFFAKNNVNVELISCPSGTGQLIEKLGNGSIDIAIGLTEGFVRSIASGNKDFQMVGTYVQSPLRWAISTGADRTSPGSEADLEGSKCGVSRMGSGSDVMSRVLQLNNKWTTPFQYEVCNTFANLRDAVNSKKADFFLWEIFTSNKFYQTGEIKYIGEIHTPWPSWVITAKSDVLNTRSAEVEAFTKTTTEGIEYFNSHIDEGIQLIKDNWGYSTEDVNGWLKTVEFSKNAGYIDPAMVKKTLETLQQAIELPKDCDKNSYIYKF